MALNQPFTTVGPINAVFDYNDFASGSGYEVFYGGHHSGGYVLSPTTFYSEKVQTISKGASDSFTQELDIDFDTLLNIPKTLKGTALISTGVGMSTDGGASETLSSYITVRIRKWDGTTETEIANGTSGTWANTASAVREVQGYFICPVVIPETHIAAGEYLRVTIELWGKTSRGGGAGDVDFVMTHDPKNRGESVFDDSDCWDFGTDLTMMEAQIPFKLE